MPNPRQLPAIHRLVALVPDLPAPVVTEAARALVAEVRGGAPIPEAWEAAVRARALLSREPHLRRLINATGIVLHTNLGRAPLSARAARAVAEIAEGYNNLELDLATGERGERLAGVRPLLRRLCEAEDALAVNNNAAGVLLVLTALARDREVVVSRGELVEIGGSFRVPDVISAGGARLVEVGTTNRTRVADYEAALTPDTAAILRVHPSNFRITGFTETPSREHLHALARSRGVPLVEDLGAGALVEGLGEPAVATVLRHVDLCTFSGDKLLGGPQAGIIVGRAAIVERLRRHPLYRALRLDRLVLAALEATLRGYVEGEEPPAVAMLRAADLRARAERWATSLRQLGLDAAVAADSGEAGGGSLPGEGLPTWVVTLAVASPDDAMRRLRANGVIARVSGGLVRLDPRTVLPEDEESLLAACQRLAGA